MKLRVLFVFFILLSFANVLSQTQTITFNYTGSFQIWVVPSCVTSINTVVAGAKGGGLNGGSGARITANIPVTPGQILYIYCGGMGTQGNNSGGWNGGGNGYSSTGSLIYSSWGGGGASDIRIGGQTLANRVIVGGGGGGRSGGSSQVCGGAANCNNGAQGCSTYGQGGGGGTQASGGFGGAPWAGVPTGGQAGTLGQGGNGGFWQTASGGGGGGGRFGGGGGGNDGCCTGGNGGGGGGGGSSLIPVGGTCIGANNSGNGYVTITYTSVNLTVNPTSTNVTCFGFCNGTASSNVTTPGATFLWNPGGQTTSSISNLCPGTYTVTVNVNGCTATGTVTITQPPQVTIGPIQHN